MYFVKVATEDGTEPVEVGVYRTKHEANAKVKTCLLANPRSIIFSGYRNLRGIESNVTAHITSENPHIHRIEDD